MNIIQNVDRACAASIHEAETLGGRSMTEDEKRLFEFGFISGVQHGLEISTLELAELKEMA